MENLRICLVQMNIEWERPAANRRIIEQALAGQEGKHDLIALPEMFTTGFSMNAHEIAETLEGETAVWMQGLATRMGAVVMGSIVVKEDGNFFNRMLVVHQGGTALTYDKRHLFQMAGEHEVYTSGVDMYVFTVKGWRILPQICYDLRFPVFSRNKPQEDGRLYYDLAVYVANWPERRSHHWKSLLVARAIENQAFVAGLNRVGSDGKDIAYSGDSAIIDPLGTTLVYASTNPVLLIATLDWEHLANYRHRFPAWADADRFDLYA